MLNRGLNPLTDSSFLQAICEGDTSAWCFIPVLASQSAYCSRPFRDLWQIPADFNDTPWIFQYDQFVDALKNTNVSAEEFFAEVNMHSNDSSHRIRIARIDGVIIYATVKCVFSERQRSVEDEGEMTGWLIRFHVQNTMNSIDILLNEITKAQKQLAILSQREIEILDLVYEGRTNKAISIVTGISEKTIEKHRARVSAKLGLSSSTMMIRVITTARMLPDRNSCGIQEAVETPQLSSSLPSSISRQSTPPVA